jgi:hypothetical protein
VSPNIVTDFGTLFATGGFAVCAERAAAMSNAIAKIFFMTAEFISPQRHRGHREVSVTSVPLW